MNIKGMLRIRCEVKCLLVHTQDKLQNILNYLNYSGVVFHRDNEQLIQKGKPDRSRYETNISVTEKNLSEKPKIIKKCLLCTTVISKDQYKVFGKRMYLCSSCKPLVAEITII
ncbi:MAG: hypothetical protein ACFFDC_15350 [Promethearchaeota archaeon]